MDGQSDTNSQKKFGLPDPELAQLAQRLETNAEHIANLKVELKKARETRDHEKIDQIRMLIKQLPK